MSGNLSPPRKSVPMIQTFKEGFVLFLTVIRWITTMMTSFPASPILTHKLSNRPLSSHWRAPYIQTSSHHGSPALFIFTFPPVCIHPSSHSSHVICPIMSPLYQKRHCSVTICSTNSCLFLRLYVFAYMHLRSISLFYQPQDPSWTHHPLLAMHMCQYLP